MATRAVAFAVLLLWSAPAAAQDEVEGAGRAGQDSLRLDLHLDLGWYGAFGAGARLDVTIVPEGLLDGVEDDLAISPGLEVLFFYSQYYGDGVGIWPLLAFQWNFYLSDAWAIFPELGIIFFFAQESRYYERYWSSFIAPFGGFGARWTFNGKNALLMRISWPAGFQVGITF